MEKLSPNELERELLAAHHSGDRKQLAALYRQAAELSEQAARTDEACFRYTQAYVFALESGANELASELRNKLVAYGREE